MRSLGLLLEGSVCRGRPVQPVHRLLTKGPLQTQSGFSTLTRSFSLHKLLSCLQQNLTLSPFGITACLLSGKKLAWAQQGTGYTTISSTSLVFVLTEKLLEQLCNKCVTESFKRKPGTWRVFWNLSKSKSRCLICNYMWVDFDSFNLKCRLTSLLKLVSFWK